MVFKFTGKTVEQTEWVFTGTKEENFEAKYSQVLKRDLPAKSIVYACFDCIAAGSDFVADGTRIAQANFPAYVNDEKADWKTIERVE